MPIELLLLQQVPDSLPGAIVRTVNDFTDFLLGYVVALAAIGALAMALIEGWKKFWDSRTKFQAKRFTSWVRKSLKEVVLTRGSDPIAPAATIADVLQLCTGVSRIEAAEAARELVSKNGSLPALHAFRPRPSHALFALDIDRMMGAIQEAADVALSSPKRYAALYAFLTTGGDQNDVNRWFDDAETGFTEIADLDESNAKQRQQVKELSDTAARLRHVIKRKLDAFQLYTADRWGSYNQAGAIALGFVLMFGVLMSIRQTQPGTAPDVGTIILLSLLGGLLSPVAKDIVSSLKRVKNG